MHIESAVAHAIHSDLDIVEACPEVTSVPTDELETYVEAYVLSVQDAIVTAIRDRTSEDPLTLTQLCIDAGVDVPPGMLTNMMKTVTSLLSLDAKFIQEFDNGASLYYIKLPLSL